MVASWRSMKNVSRTAPGALGEFAAIGILKRELEAERTNEPPLVGIGDDAAVLSLRGKQAWSIDCSAEGIHFDLRWLTPAQAAARAFEAALSDLAAMGAAPTAALCNLQLPKQLARAELRAIGRAQARVGARVGCPIVGGNVVGGDRFQITTTVLGRTSRPLLRSGARVGDELWLLGSVGEAAAGLSLLQSDRFGPQLWTGSGADRVAGDGAPRGLNRPDPLSGVALRAAKSCVRAWRQPRALIAEGQELVERASAAVDVSDGLASEAQHLAEAAGVELVIHSEMLAAHASDALRRIAGCLKRSVVELQLYGGEDYALLATGKRSRRPAGAQVIGSVLKGRGASLQLDKRRVPLGRGFDHLLGRSAAR